MQLLLLFRDVNLPLFGGIPLYFFTFRFFKNDFPLFLKNRPPKFFFSFTDTATIDCPKNFGKQSVTFWFAGLRFFRFRSMLESAVSALGCRISAQRSKSDARRHAVCWRTAFAPLPFHPHHFTHTHTHTYSLSHIHIHWFRAASCYDFAVACNGQSCACYTRAQNDTVTYRNSTRFSFLTQRLHSPSPTPFLSRSKRSAAKSESNIGLD